MNYKSFPLAIVYTYHNDIPLRRINVSLELFDRSPENGYRAGKAIIVFGTGLIAYYLDDIRGTANTGLCIDGIGRNFGVDGSVSVRAEDLRDLFEKAD